MRRVILGLFLVAIVAPAASAQTGKRVAVGVGITEHKYIDSDFSQKNPGISFIYRLRLKPDTKDGWKWAPTGALGWFNAKTDMAVGGVETRIGTMRSRPFMGGIERAYHQGPMNIGLSVVAGPAFNHFTVDNAAIVAYRDRLGLGLTSVTVKKSLAVRPELSMWYDLGKWFGVHASLSYMVNRPTADTTAGGVTTSSRWNTDHLNAQIGLAVGIF